MTNKEDGFIDFVIICERKSMLSKKKFVYGVVCCEQYSYKSFQRKLHFDHTFSL